METGVSPRTGPICEGHPYDIMRNFGIELGKLSSSHLNRVSLCSHDRCQWPFNPCMATILDANSSASSSREPGPALFERLRLTLLHPKALLRPFDQPASEGSSRYRPRSSESRLKILAHQPSPSPTPMFLQNVSAIYRTWFECQISRCLAYFEGRSQKIF